MTKHPGECEVYGKATVCKCPKCGRMHKRKINFIGRGIPRKYCEQCDWYVEQYNGIEDAHIVPVGHFGSAVRAAVNRCQDRPWSRT